MDEHGSTKKPASALDRALVFLARLGPLGRLPAAPGTWASAAAALAAPWLFLPFSQGARLAILGLILVVGVLAAGRAEQVLGQKDPGQVVIDELLGQWAALLPFSALKPWEIVLAFALFRAFDIIKPWPVRRAESLFPGGLGVMADDLLAGAWAALGLVLVRLAAPLFS
ncbi:MAG: phosphatidylglycerophosphatase A [Desulfovibrionaceae bacterium]|nr:phosphatidylglycerophosphatase A [Desulfovibrionaceae bacterium]